MKTVLLRFFGVLCTMPLIVITVDATRKVSSAEFYADLVMLFFIWLFVVGLYLSLHSERR